MKVPIADKATIAGIAQRLLEHPFKCWFYGDSIGFEGLLAAAKLLDDKKIVSFIHGYCRAWASRMIPYQPDDNTAPGHAMCSIVEQTGDQLLQAAVVELATHLLSRRKRNGVSLTFEDTRRSLMQPYGGAKLSPSQSDLMVDPGPGVYVDCMHFDPPFFAHLARIDKGASWESAAASEILGYKDLLLDRETGLYCHFWLEKTDQAYTRGWGRGQGWALLGLLDVCTYLPDHAREIEDIRREANRLARAMVSYQRHDGNWYCLVHDERSGPESSTAAFMATAFFRGIATGVLSEQEFAGPAELALEAMKRNLDTNGNLRGVSAAVYSALVEEHYWHVPLDQIVPWGQGPVLTAFDAARQYRER